jgi:hypothetical protein
MANHLTRQIDQQAGSFSEAIGKTIDENRYPAEENRELAEELHRAEAREYQEETDSSVNDRQQARQFDERILKSKEVDRLNKHIHPILAIIIVGFTLTIYLGMLFFMDRINEADAKDIIIYILGAMTTISTQVVAYYFGSSQGSREKQESIKHLANHIMSNPDL